MSLAWLYIEIWSIILKEGLNHRITRNLVNWLWINVVGEKVWPSIHPLEHKAITVLARKKVEHLGNSLVPPGKMQHFANQDASATLLACLQGPCMQKFHKWLTCTYAKKPLLRVSIAAAQKFHFSWEFARKIFMRLTPPKTTPRGGGAPGRALSTQDLAN